MAVVSRWTRVTVSLAAAGAVLVACGDDKKSSAPTTTLATTTTLSQAQLDKQKAERAVLAAADLPGFTQDPPEANDTPELEAAANACVNNNPVLVQLGEDTDAHGVDGADFSKGDALSVSSSVTFADTEDQARSAITDASAATVGNCLARALQAELRKDPSVTNVTVTAAKLPNLAVGGQTVGYRVTTRAREGSRSVTIYTDFTFIQVGRGLAVLDGFSLGTVFPEAERVRLAMLLAQRMAA